MSTFFSRKQYWKSFIFRAFFSKLSCEDLEVQNWLDKPRLHHSKNWNEVFSLKGGSQALKVQLKSRIHCKIFWWGESSMCEGLTKGENGPTPSNCKRNRAQRIYRLAGHHDHIQFFYKWLNFYAETKKSSASWRLSKGLLFGSPL